MKVTILFFVSVLSTTISGLSTTLGSSPTTPATTLPTNATSSPNCSLQQKEFVLNDSQKSYGSVGAFYNIGSSICKSLQPQLNDDYLEVVSGIYDKLMNGKFSLNEPISLAKQQAGAIVFIAIGVILIIGVPISGIIFCCVRSCGGCGAKRKHKPSKCALSIWLSMLTVALLFLIVAAAVYPTACQDIVDNADGVLNMTNDITDDIANVLTAAADNITCEVNEAIGSFFDDVSGIINRIPDKIFNGFEDKYGYNKMKQILNESSNTNEKFNAASVAISNASSKIEELRKESWTHHTPKNLSQIELGAVIKVLQGVNKSLMLVSERFNDVHNQLDRTFHDVDNHILEAKNQVNNSIQSADSSLQRAHRDFENVTRSVRKTVDDIKDLLKQQNEQISIAYSGTVQSILSKSGVVPGLKAIVLVPCLLVIIPALITILCGIPRLPMNDSSPSKRSVIFAVGGCIAMTGVFFGFMLSWIVSVVATFSFVGSYGIGMVCEPLFYDPQMRIFTDISFFNFDVPPITSNKSITINFGEVMKSCANHSSIFNALHGESLLDTSYIVKQANLGKYKDEATMNFNLDYTFNASKTLSLNNATETLSTVIGNIPTTLNATRSAALSSKTHFDQTVIAEEKLNETKSAIDDVVSSMQVTIDQVQEIIYNATASGDFTAKGQEVIRDVFDETIANVTDKVYSSKDTLLTHTFDCYPMNVLWKKIGNELCDVVIMPMNGIWTSAGLASLFIIVSIAALTLTAKYLQRMNPAYDRQPMVTEPFQAASKYAYKCDKKQQ